MAKAVTVAELTRFTTPGGHSCAFALRPDTSDYNTVASVMQPHDEYALPRNLSGVAVDAGAHIGSVTVALALDNPALHVVAIEPVPDNVALLRENVERAGIGERVDIIHGAVGSGPVTVWYGYKGNEIAEHHAWIGNSSLAYDNSGVLEHDEVRFDGVTIHDLVSRFGPIAFLKIDTEGGEWSFLEDAWVRFVREIVGEWHPVRGHKQLDMLDLLADTHDVRLSGPVAGPGGFRAVLR